MALEETMDVMRQQLAELSKNLEKAAKGNRAAAQRVRNYTVKFAKISKVYRKESVSAFKEPKK